MNYGGVEIWLYTVLTSALRGDGHLHDRVTVPQQEELPVSIGQKAEWSPINDLEDLEQIKIVYCPCWDSNRESFVVIPLH
jgi:hypothetical protein